MWLAVKVLVGLALAYWVVTMAAWAIQRRLMYFPDPTRLPPAEAGLSGVAERLLRTPDGETLVTWYAPATPGQPTILYFHGNAGHLAARAERMANYLARGQGMMILAYRGYSGSTGGPSEKNNVADARLAYDTLRADGIAARDIILYGESLGSGVAVQVAATREVAGIVLDAPYTSIVDVGAAAYPYLPARLMMTDRYETVRHLPKVTAPLLVVHGERDQIIPVAMGRAVHAAANPPAEIVTFPFAGHTDHGTHGSFYAVQDWIARLRSGALKREREAG